MWLEIALGVLAGAIFGFFVGLFYIWLTVHVDFGFALLILTLILGLCFALLFRK